jgi:transcriptional regulator with XRE-family HTH domain
MTKSPEPTDKHVGSMVRMRRLMLDMSQTKLADALGITFQQVQKYENGTNRISASRLQQIAEFLQVPIMFFFGGLSTMQKRGRSARAPIVPDETSALFASSDGIRLVKAYWQIKRQSLRRAIVQLVEDLPRR